MYVHDWPRQSWRSSARIQHIGLFQVGLTFALLVVVPMSRKLLVVQPPSSSFWRTSEVCKALVVCPSMCLDEHQAQSLDALRLSVQWRVYKWTWWRGRQMSADLGSRLHLQDNRSVKHGYTVQCVSVLLAMCHPVCLMHAPQRKVLRLAVVVNIACRL